MNEGSLYRSRTDRFLGGVCGGIAERFELDPTIVRLLAVVLAIIGNVAVVIAYIVMWIVVPEEGAMDRSQQDVGAADAGSDEQAHEAPQPVAESVEVTPEPVVTQPIAAQPVAEQAAHVVLPEPAQRGVRGGLVWFGSLLVVLGVLLVGEQFFPDLRIWGFWPATLLGLLFIALGVRTMFTPGDDEW